MKKSTVILAAMMMSLAMTACNQKTNDTVATEAATTETTTKAPVETETEKATEKPADKEQLTYADNFSVDNTAVVEFADKIKAAVAAKDIEALADLCFYPLYMGFADGSVSVTSRDEFIKLGAERVFTEEMMASIEGADNTKLSPSRAGFSLTKDGKPNTIFGVVNGQLAIQGMNY